MGRGRLRRGCSLEVIFEEDPDFCSHLDSLDGGVAIRFGIKEPDDTISLDSLLEVEEYQVRFQDPADAEQVFRSLDGFVDVRNMDSCMVEWDEFSMDSNSSKNGQDPEILTTESDPFLENVDAFAENSAEKVPSGRRSRVSRRQIIQATWLGYSSSSDESVTNNDPEDPDNTNSNATRQQRRRSPSNRLSKSKLGKESERRSDESSEPTSCVSVAQVETASITSPRDSPILVGSVEDFFENDGKDGDGGAIGLKTPIQLQLRSSPNNTEGAQLAPPHGIFGRADGIDLMEKDTLDSYISTMTDETDTNAYTFADPFDDTHSVASTSYESSGSTSSTESNGSVCTVNSFSMQNGKSKPNGSEGKSSSGGASNGNRVAGGGTGSKYRSNLKVELVSQLNKSQAANLHSTATTSASMNACNLYSGNSHLTLQSSSSAIPNATASSTATGTPSKYPNHQQPHRQQQPLLSHQQALHDHEGQSFGGDVKRVRALFELRNHSRTSQSGSESNNGSSSNGSTCPSSPESTSRSRSISSRNGGDTSPCGSSSGRIGLYSKNGRRSRGSPQNQPHPHSSPSSTAASPNKVLRSAYSNLSSTKANSPVGGSNTNISGSNGGGQASQPSYDYVDLLVNDKVVIEDAPDIYQANRSRRHANLDRDVLTSLSNSRPLNLLNLSPRDVTSGGSLRRSRSMGTGISALGSPTAYCMESGTLKQSSSKTNILAEELPAPDTVKNVRNVFENMLKMRGNNNGSESSVDSTPTGFSGSFSIVKKSLSYIKSNPTSKIYRSESMRDDFPSMGRRFGKPVLMSEATSPVHSPSYPSFVASSSPPTSSAAVGGGVAAGSASESMSTAVSSAQTTAGDVVDGKSRSSPLTKNSIERKISEPAKFSPKINTGLSPCSVPSMLRSSCQAPLAEEEASFSSNVTTEDYRSRKYVHSDVLQKIRSAGTTTTYFGGKVVAKTIKNRKVPVARRHTFDFQDYAGISGNEPTYNNYDAYSYTNYYRDDEPLDKGRGGTANTSGSRPALDIPLKSSSSNSIYASRNTTISGALDSIFGGVGGLLTFASKPIDTTPRIISVLTKSPPGSQTGSPVKSCSPASSVIEEGRNSPEGCEASNEKAMEQDGNNNNLPEKVASSSRSTSNGHADESESFNKKFSQITEGAWF